MRVGKDGEGTKLPLSTIGSRRQLGNEGRKKVGRVKLHGPVSVSITVMGGLYTVF